MKKKNSKNNAKRKKEKVMSKKIENMNRNKIMRIKMMKIEKKQKQFS